MNYELRSVSDMSSDTDCLLLCDQAQLRRLEGVLLRHGVFRPVQAVQDQLAEEGIARHAGRVDILLSLPVHQEHMAAAVLLARRDGRALERG